MQDNALNQTLVKFLKLLGIDISDKIEKRNGLSYVSWSYAWAEFKKEYPDANYEIKKFKTFADDEKGMRLVPYMYDKNTGYMVNTSITADGQTYEMWLPVIDSNNNAMKSEPYTYQVKEYVDKKWTGKYIDKQVSAATMFDVNKAIMRCLVKNMAMFGLGLYIYAGEDLPDKITTTSETQEQKNLSISEQIIACTTEDELEAIYKANKKKIIDNDNLLGLVTEKGKKLKGLAA